MTWADIDINLEKQHNGDIKKDINIDAIINSITNIFQTFQGSRRMIPSFAMPTYGVLFEQIDDTTLDNLKHLMLSAIDMWEDRIYIKKLDVTPNYDNHQLDINLDFRLKHDVEDKIYNINKTMVMKG